MNHRLFSRRRVNARARVYTVNCQACEGQVSDMSPGGLRLQANECPLAVGDIVKLEFVQPNTRNSLGGKVRAMVIHIDDKTVGVMFANELHEVNRRLHP